MECSISILSMLEPGSFLYIDRRIRNFKPYNIEEQDLDLEENQCKGIEGQHAEIKMHMLQGVCIYISVFKAVQ